MVQDDTSTTKAMPRLADNKPDSDTLKESLLSTDDLDIDEAVAKLVGITRNVKHLPFKYNAEVKVYQSRVPGRRSVRKISV